MGDLPSIGTEENGAIYLRGDGIEPKSRDREIHLLEGIKRNHQQCEQDWWPKQRNEPVALPPFACNRG